MYRDESIEQEAVVRWMEANYPRLVFSANISGTRRGTKLQRILNGKEAKRLGYRRGIPDITIYKAVGAYHGLMIEMKSEVGRESDDQKQVRELLEAEGYSVKVCKGRLEAILEINKYITGQG